MNKHSALAKKILAWRINLGFKILPPMIWPKSKWNPSVPAQPVPIVPAPMPSESDVQRAIHLAAEKCETHPRPGNFLHEFNLARQASEPIKPVVPVRVLATETMLTLPPPRFLSRSVVGIENLTTFPSPAKTEQNELAAIPTMHNAADWLNSPMPNTGEIERSTLFDDVRSVSGPFDDDAPTVLHPRTQAR
jgi:hypothetical protein